MEVYGNSYIKLAAAHDIRLNDTTVELSIMGRRVHSHLGPRSPRALAIWQAWIADRNQPWPIGVVQICVRTRCNHIYLAQTPEVGTPVPAESTAEVPNG